MCSTFPLHQPITIKLRSSLCVCGGHGGHILETFHIVAQWHFFMGPQHQKYYLTNYFPLFLLSLTSYNFPSQFKNFFPILRFCCISLFSISLSNLLKIHKQVMRKRGEKGWEGGQETKYTVQQGRETEMDNVILTLELWLSEAVQWNYWTLALRHFHSGLLFED